MSPHMHMLGRDMRMSIAYPDGRTRDLIHIPEWDPSWQSMYYFEKPIPLPKGSVVKVVAHFDNSAHSATPTGPPSSCSGGIVSTTRCATDSSPWSRRTRTSSSTRGSTS